MGQLIKKIITTKSDTEIHVVIDLNINVVNGKVEIDTKKPDEEATVWEIPVFAPAEKVNFGKKI